MMPRWFLQRIGLYGIDECTPSPRDSVAGTGDRFLCYYSIKRLSPTRTTNSLSTVPVCTLWRRMPYPDYSAQGWKNIVVSLDGPIAILKLDRAKQYVTNAPSTSTNQTELSQ